MFLNKTCGFDNNIGTEVTMEKIQGHKQEKEVNSCPVRKPIKVVT